jgi:uncharacterized tellurite resistance protein B-like protein
MVIHKSFADFVLFLYVHMAHTDGDYDGTEKEVILKKIPKIFPREADPKAKLEKAQNEYHSVDASLIPAIIRETFKQFSDVKFSQKYKVYTDMYDIINADGRIDESETAAMNELKEIIEMGAAK